MLIRGCLQTKNPPFSDGSSNLNLNIAYDRFAINCVAPLANTFAFFEAQQAVAFEHSAALADFEHSLALATLVLAHAVAHSLPSPACNEPTAANAAIVKQKMSFFIRFWLFVNYGLTKSLKDF